MLNLKAKVIVATTALHWTFKPIYQEIGLRFEVGKRLKGRCVERNLFRMLPPHHPLDQLFYEIGTGTKKQVRNDYKFVVQGLWFQVYVVWLY